MMSTALVINSLSMTSISKTKIVALEQNWVHLIDIHGRNSQRIKLLPFYTESKDDSVLHFMLSVVEH